MQQGISYGMNITRFAPQSYAKNGCFSEPLLTRYDLPLNVLKAITDEN